MEGRKCVQSLKQTSSEGDRSQNEISSTTPPYSQQVCAKEQAHSLPADEEPCDCKCQHGLLEALQACKSKASALEEINKRSTETHESQALEWQNERERLLEVVSEMESNSMANNVKMQELKERLSIAECAVEQLTKSKKELLEEVSKSELETSQAYDKLKDSECLALSLQEIKENEISVLSAALQARNKSLEGLQAEIARKERMVNELSNQLSSLQDGQQHHALLQQECSAKSEDLQKLSEAHKQLKSQLQAVVEGHAKEMDYVACQLQEALNSRASKDSKIESLISDLNTVHRDLENVRAFKTKANQECHKLQEDLALAIEAQYAKQLGLDKAFKEVVAMREALTAKDDVIASLKAQQIQQEKIHQENGEVVERELQQSKSKEKELLTTLGQEQRKVTSLENLRRTEIESSKLQDNNWRDERERLSVEVSSMHNLIESKGVLVKELEEKLQRADGAIQHLRESRGRLQEENNELHIQLQEMQVQLRDIHSGLELVEKEKQDKVSSLSNILQAKLKDLEIAHQETAQHQKTMSAMAADLENLQEVHRECALLKEALKMKEEEVSALSESQERFREQLKALEDDYHKDKDHLITQLDKALQCKARTEQHLEEYKVKVACLQSAQEKTHVSITESEVEKKKLSDNLARLQEDNLTLQQNLHVHEEHTRGVKEAFVVSLSKKEDELKELKQQIAGLETTLSHMMQQEQNRQEKVAECEALHCELKQKQILLSELHESHKKALYQWVEKENTWISEMEVLNSRAQMAEQNLTVTSDKLQTTVSELECSNIKVKDYEQRMRDNVTEIAQLQMKLEESNTLLHSEKQEFQNIQNTLHLKSSALTTLLQEKEFALSEAHKKVEELESKVLLESNKNIACADQIRFLKSESLSNEARIKELSDIISHLKKSLLESREESSRAIETKDKVEATLSNAREEIRTLERESEMQMQDLGHAISKAERKLQQALESRQMKEQELEALLVCLEKKDKTINDLKISEISLTEEKEVLKQAVIALQAKVEMHALAVESEKSLSQQLCSCMEEKDMMIASKSEEIKDLQHMLSLSKSEIQKVDEYEEKLRRMKDELTQASASQLEKEERLLASEWAVQQLANEIGKAKSSLVQKEREELLLQSRLSDLEARFRAKDRELVEVDCYVQSLVKKNSQKQSEVERLTQAAEKFERRTNDWNVERQGLIAEIGRLSNLLEEKDAELLHLAEQGKQKQIREGMMEDAMQCLKSQLAGQVLLLDEQESRSQQMVQELEAVHTEKDLIAGSLKEAERKLKEADQLFKEETEKLENKLLHTQEKLSILSVSHAGVERELLAALEEIESQKKKLCSLTELSVAKDSSLTELGSRLDALQKELAEQNQLMNNSGKELIHTQEELDRYIEKETKLRDEIRELHEKLLQQKEILTKNLNKLAAEISVKDEEIKQLKAIKENAQSMSTERESLIEEVSKLRKDLHISGKTVQDREVEVSRLKEMKKGLKTDLRKVREDMVKTVHVSDSTSAALRQAENKCLALEGDLTNATVELRTQVQKANSLVELNSHLNAELESKQNLLNALNIETKSALDVLNSKLDNFCRKEAAMVAQAAMLVEEMQENLYTSRQHDAETIQPVMSEIVTFLEQPNVNRTNEIELCCIELTNVNKSIEPVLENSRSEDIQIQDPFLALQRVIQDFQNEGQRRRKVEGLIFELARNVVLRLATKEQEMQDLTRELGCLKEEEEDWGKCLKEMLSSQLEFENEFNRAVPFSHPSKLELHSIALQPTLEAKTCITDMKRLSEGWKLIINAYKECTLSILCLIREDAAQSSCKLSEVDGAFVHSGSWSERLPRELTQLRQTITLLIEEVNQKDSALADSMKTLEFLQNSLREVTVKEKGAQEQISTLESFLMNLKTSLSKTKGGTFENFNALLMDRHPEIESFGATFTKSGSLQLQLERTSLLAEELNREIMSRCIETDRELARLKELSESASILNKDLIAQLAEMKYKIKQYEEKEHSMEEELQDVKEKVRAMEEETSSLMLQLTQAAEVTRHLELQIDKKEEELSCLQMQMDNLMQKFVAQSKKNQDLVSELAMVEHSIEGIKIKVKQLQEEKDSMQLKVCEEMQALQTEFDLATENNQQEMECIMAEKHHLQLDLHDWKGKTELNAKDNALLRLELENLLQTTKDLQGRLEMAENMKQQFENLCLKLEADLVRSQNASQERENLLSDALTRLQEGSQHNRMTVEARFQVLYNAMLHHEEEEEEEEGQVAYFREGFSGAEKDHNFIKTGGCQSSKFTLEGLTFLQRDMDDNGGCREEQGNPSSVFASQMSFSSSKMERQVVEDSHQELDQYLEICDSLIRRHAQLEKQLENLVASNSGVSREVDGCSGMDEDANKSENKKRRLADLQAKRGSTRKPLEPITLFQHIAMESTPNACVKRRRSSNSSTFEDQNTSL